MRKLIWRIWRGSDIGKKKCGKSSDFFSPKSTVSFQKSGFFALGVVERILKGETNSVKEMNYCRRLPPVSNFVGKEREKIQEN